MAQYKKGKSGNPQGRPKGSTNKKTTYIKDWIISLIGSNAQSLAADFNNLPRKEKWKVITSLMPYVLPKQTESKVNANIDFNQLSDEQIDSIITSIEININDNDGTE